MSWRKSAGTKYFPTPSKVKASSSHKKRVSVHKKNVRKKNFSSTVPNKNKKRKQLPEWYPSNRRDPSAFTAAADLVAQMRYEQLIESRAQRLMREYWADGFTEKQKAIKKTSMMNHYGENHPKNRRHNKDLIYDFPKQTGFLEPIDAVNLISDEQIDKLAEEDAAKGSNDRFERKVRIDHLKHNFVESRMLTRKLKEIQIEWDDKMKRQREQKAKSKFNTIERKRRGLQLKPGQFEPYEETKELSKINKWLERHNESALKNKIERERLEAIKNREKRKARKAHYHQKESHRHRIRMKNSIRHGAWVENPPDYLFNSDTFHTDGFGDDVFVDDVDLNGTKVYNNKNIKLIGEAAIKRKVKQDNAKVPYLPPISMITPCSVISGGRKVHKPYKWR